MVTDGSKGKQGMRVGSWGLEAEGGPEDEHFGLGSSLNLLIYCGDQSQSHTISRYVCTFGKKIKLLKYSGQSFFP